MKILLVSAYELGHQPLGVAGPAGILRARGHDVRALDLSLDQWDPALAAWADKVAFSVPMHTAARLAIHAAASLRPSGKPVAAYGLYAAMCGHVADALVSRDPDVALARWIEGSETIEPGGALPARDLLPDPGRYARLEVNAESLTVGYVEASRGCSHRCRHCPVPVVFDGRIRVVDVDDVVADVAQQVAAGARHVTFGDPDFFNGVHHSRRVVQAVHAAFPDLTFDCTVKVEHILRFQAAWAELAASGLLFVISAFESVNDATLIRLDKGHTAEDGVRAVKLLREHGIEIRPTWLPFTPWATFDDVRDIVEFVAAQNLIGNVDPVQYTIRLLLPAGSLLLGDVEGLGRLDGIGAFDPERLSYEWTSPLDPLQAQLAALVENAPDPADPALYNEIRAALDLSPVDLRHVTRAARMTEPWFCCSEPTDIQLAAL